MQSHDQESYSRAALPVSCPDCGGMLVSASGCEHCVSCGLSRCDG